MSAEDKMNLETFQVPGRHAFAQARGIGAIVLGIVGLCLVTIGVAFFSSGGTGSNLVVILFAAVALMLVAYRVASPSIDRWLQGARGEQHVGEVLADFEDAGWLTLHDINLGGDNIAHILIGPGGLFLVGTESDKGRISVDRISPKLLKEINEQKKAIERVTSFQVQPLLVFSDAWLIGSVPGHRRGVVVLPARMVASFISRQRPVATTEQARALHSRLIMALQS